MRQDNDYSDMKDMQMDGLEDYWMNGHANSIKEIEMEHLPNSNLSNRIKVLARGRLLNLFGHAMDMGSMIGFVLVIVVGDTLVRILWTGAETIMKSAQSFVTLLPPGGF